MFRICQSQAEYCFGAPNRFMSYPKGETILLDTYGVKLVKIKLTVFRIISRSSASSVFKKYSKTFPFKPQECISPLFIDQKMPFFDRMENLSNHMASHYLLTTKNTMVGQISQLNILYHRKVVAIMVVQNKAL